ncbi:hypothetical protein DQ04_00351090 [Trypanosoma grayi]|uniref:hypothetical protein n=1 Tax=Trypanosoma grayi TaxID=71804 RepID=UPI0004F40B51|nr:hypothetical protein DQ04_00351090 [Trypanosoma grayi]KEG14672.1 hypothetical protein DQ04_00351090 [Trypanosoma grayi]
MLPVAGRRKGQAPLSAPPPTVSAPPPTGNEPDWLFGDSDAIAVGPATTRGTAAAAPAPPATHDALSFLEFDDEPTSFAPPPPRASPPVAVAAPAPAAAAAAAATPVPSNHVGPVSASLRARCEKLQGELQGVRDELLHCEKRTALLESGEDEACLEVKALEKQVRAKQEEEEHAAAIMASVKAALKQRQERLREEGETSEMKDLNCVMDALRAQYANEVKHLETLVEQQKGSLAAVEERHRAMGGTVSTTEPYERALGQLQDKLRAGISEIGTGMCMRVKPILVGSIREVVAQSAQQRLDIFSNDRRQRREQRDSFQHAMNQAFEKFREERRITHRSRLDSIFGHSMMKARLALENRLTATRQQFADQQRATMAEACMRTQRTIDEMVQRSQEELAALETKFMEEQKRKEERYTAELSHQARLYTAERDALVRRQHRFDNTNSETTPPSVYKAVEKSVGGLQERVEQLKQSVSFDIQAISSAFPGIGSETYVIKEKERMLQESEERTRQLSHQFGVQWQRFRAAVAPLEQCVNSMTDTLRDGRVRAAAALQGVECAYRAWNQDVRRELARSLTIGMASSDNAELQDGVAIMTQVTEDMLGQMHALQTVHRDVWAAQRGFASSITQELVDLATQHTTADTALHSVFDAYDRLARAAAEVEARRGIVEAAEADHAISQRQLEREKSDFQERLKVAQQLSAKVQCDARSSKVRPSRQRHTEKYSRVLRDLTSENVLHENTPRGKVVQSSSQSPQERQQLIVQRRRNLLAEGVPIAQTLSRYTSERDVDGTSSRNESFTDFVSLLTVDDASSQTLTLSGVERRDERRTSPGSGYVPSSDRMYVGGDGKSLTTPSTSNS